MSAPPALIWFYNSPRGHLQPEKRRTVLKARVQVDEAENCGTSQTQIGLNEEGYFRLDFCVNVIYLDFTDRFRTNAPVHVWIGCYLS